MKCQEEFKLQYEKFLQTIISLYTVASENQNRTFIEIYRKVTTFQKSHLLKQSNKKYPQSPKTHI